MNGQLSESFQSVPTGLQKSHRIDPFWPFEAQQHMTAEYANLSAML